MVGRVIFLSRYFEYRVEPTTRVSLPLVIEVAPNKYILKFNI